MILWVGDLPEYVKKVIEHNTYYFDKIYMFTDQLEFKLPKVEVIDYNEFKKFICEFMSSRVPNIKEIVDSLSKGQCSDLVYLFGKQYLKIYYPIIKADATFIFFNYVQIQLALTLSARNLWHCLKGIGYYPQNNFAHYNNAKLMIVTRNYDIEELDKLGYIFESYEGKYTHFGPSLLNNPYNIKSFNIATLPYRSYEFSYDTLPRLIGQVTINIIDKALGFGWCNTTLRRYGHVIESIDFTDFDEFGSIKFYFSHVKPGETYKR